MTRKIEVSVPRSKVKRTSLSYQLISYGLIHLVLSAMFFFLPDLIEGSRYRASLILCLIFGPLAQALYLHFKHLKNIPAGEST